MAAPLNFRPHISYIKETIYEKELTDIILKLTLVNKYSENL